MGILKGSFAALLLTSMVLLLGPLETSQAQREKPNIVVIQTDDQTVSDMRFMPKTRKVLGSQGTTFENSYTPLSVCCPSRSSLLRGQYAHNHGVVTSNGPNGGYDKFKELGLGESNVATWLDDAGYQTVHIGKYLNGYAEDGVPPGWDFWNTYYGPFHKDRKINNNGKVQDYPNDTVLDNVAANKAEFYINRLSDDNAPMYMQIDTFAPHGPHQYSEKYEGAYENARAPRKPSTNERDMSDKPSWVRGPKRNLRQTDSVFRERVRSMRTADDLVGDVARALRKSGELGNTYIVFTSDNGWQYAEHRIYGKWTPYEESIRVPTIVRGPDVPKGETRDEMIINNDWAPTFAELAGAKTPDFVDGTSIAPLLRGGNPPWRNRFLVESFRREEDLNTAPAPTYNGVRSLNFKWVKYFDESIRHGVAGRELYALNRDPYELRSIHRTAPDNLRGTLERMRRQLEDCSGDECSTAEGFPR